MAFKRRSKLPSTDAKVPGMLLSAVACLPAAVRAEPQRHAAKRAKYVDDMRDSDLEGDGSGESSSGDENDSHCR